MYKKKSFLAIIPARGGSKGLPGKNIKNLNGKPLIAWTIETAMHSDFLDEVMVTSDDSEIIEVSTKYGAKAPFIRPSELALDATPSIDVVFHCIDYYEGVGKKFDYIVLLEPTSPLREKDDIDNMIRKIASNPQFDSIISIGEVGLHPSIMKRIEKDGNLSPFCRELKRTTRRQDNEKAYFPFGVAYIAKTASLQNEKTFYTEKSTYYMITRTQCYEIDDLYDFLTIEMIINNGKI